MMNKKIISLLMITVFVLGFAAQALCEDESITMKYTKYQAEKKEPWIAVIGECFLPTLGYWYADNWPRGIPVLVADIVGLTLIFSNVKMQSSSTAIVEDRSQALIGVLICTAATVFACFDSYAITQDYNRNLMKKYGLQVTLKELGPALQMGYSF